MKGLARSSNGVLIRIAWSTYEITHRRLVRRQLCRTAFLCVSKRSKASCVRKEHFQIALLNR